MIRYGRKLRLTKHEKEVLAIESQLPRIETVDDYVAALKAQYEYFSDDTPTQRLLRGMLEAGISQAEQMARESAGKVG